MAEHEAVLQQHDVVLEGIGPHCRAIDATRRAPAARHPFKGYSNE
jgi:hypothetical protein